MKKNNQMKKDIKKFEQEEEENIKMLNEKISLTHTQKIRNNFLFVSLIVKNDKKLKGH